MDGRPECQFEGLNQWREDMKERDATEARRVLQEQMKDNNVTAARAVLSETKTTNKKKVSAKPKLSTSDTDSNVTDFLQKWENKDG